MSKHVELSAHVALQQTPPRVPRAPRFLRWLWPRLLAWAAHASDYLEGEVIDHVFRGIAIFTPPANIYVGLFTSAPSDAGGGVEVSGGAYARVAVGTASGWGGAAGSGATSNVAAIEYAEPTADWGEVTHLALFSAVTAGNMFAWGPITEPQTVLTGRSPRLAAGALTVALN